MKQAKPINSSDAAAYMDLMRSLPIFDDPDVQNTKRWDNLSGIQELINATKPSSRQSTTASQIKLAAAARKEQRKTK